MLRRNEHFGRAIAAVGVALLLGAASLATPRPAEAFFLGDPTLTVGMGRFAVGAGVDLGLSGDLETNRFFLDGSYGFARNLDAYGRIGFFDGDADAGPVEASVDGFGFGGGVRMDLVQQKEWHFGGLAQAMYFFGDSEVTIPGIPGFIPPTTITADFDFLELDVAGAASYRGFGPIVPYVGAKIGLITGDPDTDFGFTLFGGGSYVINRNFTVGAELRLIDDDAVGFYLRYTF